MVIRPYEESKRCWLEERCIRTHMDTKDVFAQLTSEVFSHLRLHLIRISSVSSHRDVKQVKQMLFNLRWVECNVLME